MPDELLEPERNGFYAPQVFTDENGRVIVIGWMPEADNVPHKGWSGVMSLPRLMHVTEDGLCMEPVPGAESLPGVRRFSVARQELPAEWTIHRSADGTEETTLSLGADGTLLLSRLQSSLDERPAKSPVVRSVPLREINDVFIAVDGSAVECAVNGKWLSARIYPTKD